MIQRYRMYLAAAAVCLAAAFAIRAQPQSPAPAADSNVVACRVLETHLTGQPALAAVIFHQRDRQDQQRLGELLKSNSGTSVEIQVGHDQSAQSATVFRLKSCFGRGLLLMPATGAPKDGEIFKIKFPATGGAGASSPR